ncbi:MAG TPA: GntR family transcriptional regulator, partial [Planctomycetota bacterium]|nr:GntR family transcriptional regulator [Planctomycetota bacterium]
MAVSDRPEGHASVGRSSSELAGKLIAEISSGSIQSGSFLLGERELSAKHSVARMTARRALKVLEAEGFVRAERGQGYRVLSRVNDPTKGCPIAFVLESQDPRDEWRGMNFLLLKGLQQGARRRGWPVLGVGTAGEEAESILEQCVSARVWGVIADTYCPELIRLAARNGLPVVMVDSWEPSLAVDVVFQNGFQGGAQAIDYLVGRGHRRIAWYGQITLGPHSAARFGGAYTAMLQHGLDLPSECRVDVMKPGAQADLRRLLARPDRPSAVAALWQPNAREAHEIIRDMGLAGEVELVGWTPAEDYEEAMPRMFAGGPMPAVITWSLAEMVEVAIERLENRRLNPNRPPVTINIQTKLRLPVAASVS